LAFTLNEAFDNYRAALERLDRFSLDAAHQLRNPLASVRAAGEICLQRERSIAEYRDTVGSMVEDARRLSYTVDQLLLVARLAKKDLEEVFESLDLAELVRDVVESVNPAFETASINLRFETSGGPFRMHGSPKLLEQAVANLLDNAFRFTPSCGNVALTVRRAGPGIVCLDVADSGPGLSLLSRSNSGEPARGPARIRGNEGTGLGLLVVNNVVRAHGGAVHAKVSEWGGACISIELPADAPTLVRSAARAPSSNVVF
jgi:signal transduction histidine kinase